MTKIDIVSGFLGAGKTTLIKKLLAEALSGTQTVLIENEFGEIGIDGGFLKDAGIEIREMNSGCICCSLVGDFGEALKEVLNQYHPDRIIIEPSGVGKLSDVMKAVNDAMADQDVELNSAVAVVDAKKAKMYAKNFGEFFINQIEHAGTVVLSKTGDISEDKLKECVDLVKEHNSRATVITTVWDELSGGNILKTIEGATDLEAELMKEAIRVAEEHEHEHHHHHHHHDGEAHPHTDDGDTKLYYNEEDAHDADEVFQSIGVETAHTFTPEEIKEKLDVLTNDDSVGNILRAKGIVRGTENKWYEFDYVAGDSEIRETTPDVGGRLVVIGENLDAKKLYDLMKG